MPPQLPQITCDQWAEKVAASCCDFWVNWADAVLSRLNEEHAKFAGAHQTDSADFLHVSVKFINNLRTSTLTDCHNGTAKRVFLDKMLTAWNRTPDVGDVQHANTRYSPETLIEATDNEISTSVLLAIAAMPTPITFVDEILKRATRKLAKVNDIDWLQSLLPPDRLDELAKAFAKKQPSAPDTAVTAIDQCRELERRSSAGAPRYQYRNTGAVYEVRFEGEVGTIDATLDGSRYIAELLAKPHERVTAVVLRGDIADRGGNENKERLDDLQSEIETTEHDLERARRDGDQAAIARYTDEIQTYHDAAKKLVNRSGEPRYSLNDSARVAVTKAIRLVIAKCGEGKLPKFAKYLENSIRLGKYCVYQPGEPQPKWEF